MNSIPAPPLQLKPGNDIDITSSTSGSISNNASGGRPPVLWAYLVIREILTYSIQSHTHILGGDSGIMLYDPQYELYRIESEEGLALPSSLNNINSSIDNNVNILNLLPTKLLPFLISSTLASSTSLRFLATDLSYLMLLRSTEWGEEGGMEER